MAYQGSIYLYSGKILMCIQYRQHNIKQQKQNSMREDFTLQLVIRLYWINSTKSQRQTERGWKMDGHRKASWLLVVYMTSFWHISNIYISSIFQLSSLENQPFNSLIMFVKSEFTLIQTRIGLGRAPYPEKGTNRYDILHSARYWIYCNMEDTLGCNAPLAGISSLALP